MHCPIPITGIIFMISGKIFPNRHELIIAALCYLFIAQHCLADNGQDLQTSDLKKLLEPFSNIQHVKLAYEEKRYSVFLKHPRQYSGYIAFTRPDQFIKQIETPSRKKLHIQSDRLSIYTDHQDGNQNKQKTTSLQKTIVLQKTMSLDDYPQFKQLQALFSGLLSGDASILKQYYHYDIQSLPEEKVLLTLRTHSSDAFIEKQQSISGKIAIIFQTGEIKTITMTGFGGEKSELSFTAVLEKQVIQ